MRKITSVVIAYFVSVVIADFVCSLPRKNTRKHSQSPKLENPAGNDRHVGPFEDEHPETATSSFN
jgi:hypothetical protein